MRKALTALLVMLVKIYKYIISPVMSNACRYTPTCSAYAMEALKKHGPFKGTILSVKRILSCNPWGGHGYDPVP